MSQPQFPLLLYVQPLWHLHPQRVYLYIQEKRIPAEFVKIVPVLNDTNSHEYPQPPNKVIPKLALPKPAAKTSPSSTDSYTWLVQSQAILEYLEDLCDANPQLSPVSSLRGGENLERRCAIRGVMDYIDQLTSSFNVSCLIGSKAYNEMFKRDDIHAPSARAIAGFVGRTNLPPLDKLLQQACDFEGLENDSEGGATIADISLYATWLFLREVHGSDVARGYPNIERLIKGMEKRKRIKESKLQWEYPDFINTFRTGFVDGVWPKAEYAEGE